MFFLSQIVNIMIERIVTLSLISIGVCSTMWEGMIFERLGDMIEETLGETWAKPLGKCYVCSSFWISLVVCLVAGWQWWLCVPTMGLCAVISVLQNED
jgi:hypothetical protein